MCLKHTHFTVSSDGSTSASPSSLTVIAAASSGTLPAQQGQTHAYREGENQYIHRSVFGVSEVGGG